MSSEEWKGNVSKLSLEQKVAFLLLLVLGFGGVIYGFLSFGANLQRPFDIQLSQYKSQAGDFVFKTEAQQEADEIAAMRTRDTDGDGLTDYDESYVYKTSAYLSDSDSDGFDDHTEIFSGNDPNCPQGADCGQITASPLGNEDGVAANDAAVETPFFAAGFDPFLGGGANIETTGDLLGILRTLPPEAIRQTLLDSGIPAETLDQVSDQELLELLEASLLQLEESGELDALLSGEGGVIQENPTF